MLFVGAAGCLWLAISVITASKTSILKACTFCCAVSGGGSHDLREPSVMLLLLLVLMCQARLRYAQGQVEVKVIRIKNHLPRRQRIRKVRIRCRGRTALPAVLKVKTRFVRELEELSSHMLRCLPALFETSHARKQHYLAFFAHSLHSLKTVIDKR